MPHLVTLFCLFFEFPSGDRLRNWWTNNVDPSKNLLGCTTRSFKFIDLCWNRHLMKMSFRLVSSHVVFCTSSLILMRFCGFGFWWYLVLEAEPFICTWLTIRLLVPLLMPMLSTPQNIFTILKGYSWESVSIATLLMPILVFSWPTI